MGGDLGAGRAEVHAAAREVLDFWFDELEPAQHFARDAELDAEIARRFGELRERVLRSQARDWRDSPIALLAAVILLDQMSRNIHRGRPQAFEADGLAQALTAEAMRWGWDIAMRPDRRMFLYMPLMHAEDLELQRLGLRFFEALGLAEQVRYAREHLDVIERFGRFPSRNAALGRESTPEELEYLSQPGAGW